MNSELLQARGRLTELERRHHELDIATSSDIALARNLINPLEVDVEKLKTEEIRTVVGRMLQSIKDMRELSSQMRKVKEFIGIL